MLLSGQQTLEYPLTGGLELKSRRQPSLDLREECWEVGVAVECQEGAQGMCAVFPLLPVFNYPVLPSLLDPVSHRQNRMVQIIAIAILVVIHT